MKITVRQLKNIVKESIVTDNVFVESSTIEKLRTMHSMLSVLKQSLRRPLSSMDVGDDEAGMYTETSNEGIVEARQLLISAHGAIGDALTALEI